MSTISQDNIKRNIIPTICNRRGCKNHTSSTRVRKSCDFHLDQSSKYRGNPEIREKQKLYMRKYYKNKRKRWSEYDWKKQKLETVLKLQQIPFVTIVDMSPDFQNITLKLETPKQAKPLTSPPSPTRSVLPPIQTPLDNPCTPKRNPCTLSGTP